jgi:hypothetical protein
MTTFASNTLRFIRVAAAFFCIGKALPIVVIAVLEAMT